jgi:protein O-GlcNAc transferase
MIRLAIKSNPSAARFWVNLGTILDPMGRFDEAIAAYRQAIALEPDVPEAYNNLGNALASVGRLDEAENALNRAISLRPDYADAIFNIGNIQQDLGRTAKAVEYLTRATHLRPDWAPAYNNLGTALCEIGRRDEGIAAYRRALELAPNEAGIHMNLGSAYHAKGEVDSAIVCFQAVLKLQPHSHGVLNNLGNAFKDSGRIDEAIQCYEKTLSIDGSCAPADHNRVFALALHPDNDAQSILHGLRQWEHRHARQFSAEAAQAHGNDRNPERRLKIGYISPDFRDHVVGRNVLPILRECDRAHFEVFCYSNTANTDAMTEQFRSLSDRWREITKLDDTSAANLIRADQIDILVDLSLHTGGNRLLIFARKPAPVEVTFAGYPGGTGLSAIDWRLTDPYLDPPGATDAEYVERSYRLPDSFWCYDPQAMTWDAASDAVPLEIGPLPAHKNQHITFGNLGNFSKANDRVLQLWARVLGAVSHSRMLVMAPPGDCRRRILQAMANFQVPPSRIDFTVYEPRRSYLSKYNQIDIGLDTFPYNGHTTSLDSYWMGVPVISRIGPTVVGRAGLSQLSNLGLSDLAAPDDEQFVNTAAKLAGDLQRLADLRKSLRRRMLDSPLCDARRFTRNIETAYRAMWKAWI